MTFLYHFVLVSFEIFLKSKKILLNKILQYFFFLIFENGGDIFGLLSQCVLLPPSSSKDLRRKQKALL